MYLDVLGLPTFPTNSLTLAQGYSASQWASDFAPLPLAERSFRRSVFAGAARLRLRETAPESVPDMGVFSRDLLENWKMWKKGWKRILMLADPGETDLWDRR